MKKFLKNIGLISILMAVILCSINFMVTKGLRKSDFGNLKEWRESIEGKINADILIMGSSRAWVQYSTFIIDSVSLKNSYNLGMDGAEFDLQYIRLLTYLEHNKAPETIIQNVDIDLLDSGNKQFQSYQYLPFLSDKFLKKQLLEMEFIGFSDYYIPLITYAGQPQAIKTGIMEFMGLNHLTSIKHKGFASNNFKWDGKNFEVRKKAGKFSARINLKTKNNFENYIQLCQQKNIRLILVFAPVYHEFSDLVLNFDDFRKYYKQLAVKNNLQYIDYSKSEISYNQQYFYNATHLNSTGANIFSSKLANDIK